MVELPKVGTPMFLVRSEHVSYRTRLESIDGDTISVTEPLETTGSDRPEPGQAVTLFWAPPRARIVLPCKIVHISDTAPFRWVMKPTGAPQAGNRREFVRGGGGLPVTVAADGDEVNGNLVDISEGGLRAWLPSADETLVGEQVVVSVQLEPGPVNIKGVIHSVRPTDPDPGSHTVLTYQADEKTAQMIRQHVFAWEIAERRRAVDE